MKGNRPTVAAEIIQYLIQRDMLENHEHRNVCHRRDLFVDRR